LLVFRQTSAGCLACSGEALGSLLRYDPTAADIISLDAVSVGAMAVDPNRKNQMINPLPAFPRRPPSGLPRGPRRQSPSASKAENGSPENKIKKSSSAQIINLL